jgi:NADH-quinone oxidoreductase subunit L
MEGDTQNMVSFVLQWQFTVLFPFFLLFSALFLFVVRNKSRLFIHVSLLGSGLVATLWTCLLVNAVVVRPLQYSFLWFDVGKPIFITFGLDLLGALMLALVVFVTLLVMLYSSSYMKGEAGYGRYFATLFLFAFSMVGIVFSFNLLFSFVFWELVGFSSYLLINFWYQKPIANNAARKAFIVNRVGDLGFLMGLCLFYAEFGTFELNQIYQQIEGGAYDNATVYLAGLGVFVGCVGKSAQFPLQVWLPDAMQAPTPVSALLHAATMVAAGVFLLTRLMPILHPDVLNIVIYVGAITSLVGAFCATSQTDIKKILAYSTVSQLGYMMTAFGAHSYSAPLFHLFTHAMFKACLFLCAGSVIHEMAHLKQKHTLDFDVQDIRFMGGLRKFMPYTFVAFAVACLASAGVPFTSGFLSKDELLSSIFTWVSFQSNPVHVLLPVIIVTTSVLTAFYTFKLLFVVFLGQFRLAKKMPNLSLVLHEAPWPMLVPCLVLAMLCLFFFVSPHPLSPETGWLWMCLEHPRPAFVVEKMLLEIFEQQKGDVHVLVLASSLMASTVGFALAFFFYSRKTSSLEYSEQPANVSLVHKLSFNGLYLNELYGFFLVSPFERLAFAAASFDKNWIDKCVDNTATVVVGLANILAWFDKYIVDGMVNAGVYLIYQLGQQLRHLQNGKVQSYLTLGFVVLVCTLVVALI